MFNSLEESVTKYNQRIIMMKLVRSAYKFIQLLNAFLLNYLQQITLVVMASMALMATRASPIIEKDIHHKSEIVEFSSDDNDGQGYRF